jgi:hypothetical protein
MRKPVKWAGVLRYMWNGQESWAKCVMGRSPELHVKRAGVLSYMWNGQESWATCEMGRSPELHVKSPQHLLGGGTFKKPWIPSNTKAWISAEFRNQNFSYAEYDVILFLCFFMFFWPASLYNVGNKTNLVHNPFSVCLFLFSTCFGQLRSHHHDRMVCTRRSSTHSDKYQVSYWYSYFSWWWAHSCPKHVKNRNKHTKKELCTRLVLFTRLWCDTCDVLTVAPKTALCQHPLMSQFLRPTDIRMCYYASVLQLDMHQEFHMTEYPVTRVQCKYQQYNVNILCNQRRPDHNKISIPWRWMNSPQPTKSKLDLDPPSLTCNCIIFPLPNSKMAGRWTYSLISIQGLA